MWVKPATSRLRVRYWYSTTTLHPPRYHWQSVGAYLCMRKVRRKTEPEPCATLARQPAAEVVHRERAGAAVAAPLIRSPARRAAGRDQALPLWRSTARRRAGSASWRSSWARRHQQDPAPPSDCWTHCSPTCWSSRTESRSTWWTPSPTSCQWHGPSRRPPCCRHLARSCPWR